MCVKGVNLGDKDRVSLLVIVHRTGKESESLSAALPRSQGLSLLFSFWKLIIYLFIFGRGRGVIGFVITRIDKNSKTSSHEDQIIRLEP